MPPTHLDEPQGFHDGDVCFFYCAGLNLQLKPEGVQLVKAETCPDSDVLQSYLIQAYEYAAPLRAEDVLYLLTSNEHFLRLENGQLVANAAGPEEAQGFHVLVHPTISRATTTLGERSFAVGFTGSSMAVARCWA